MIGDGKRRGNRTAGGTRWYVRFWSGGTSHCTLLPHAISGQSQAEYDQPAYQQQPFYENGAPIDVPPLPLLSGYPNNDPTADTRLSLCVSRPCCRPTVSVTHQLLIRRFVPKVLFFWPLCVLRAE